MAERFFIISRVRTGEKEIAEKGSFVGRRFLIPLFSTALVFYAVCARAEEVMPPLPAEAAQADATPAEQILPPPPPPPSPEQLAFEALRKKALETGKLELLLQYLREHPDSRFGPLAQSAIDDIQFAPYREQNTVKAYSAFIAKFPGNSNIPLARLRADELVFAPFSAQNSIESYSQFTESFPGNLLVPVADAAIEDLILADVKKANSIIAYAEFIRDHAGSERIAEVQFLKDELEYGPYKKKDTEEGYREFLRGFPVNRNRDAARARMMEQRTIRVRAETEKICGEAKMQGTYDCDFVSFDAGTLTVRIIKLSEVQQGQQLLIGGPGYAEEIQRRFYEWKNETIKRCLRILGVISVTVE